jgi:NADH-quinone oxidoreductase subunit M
MAPSIPGGPRAVSVLAFALAFAIKVPLFPFHTWLRTRRRGGASRSSWRVLLKMGTYGLLRFAFPLFPEAARHFARIFAGSWR